MIPIPAFLFRPLTISAIAFVAGAGSATYIQELRMDSNEKDHISAHAMEERELHVREQKRQERIAVAQSIATAAEVKLRDDATRSRDRSERLRSSTAKALLRARESIEACTVTAATLGTVFGECQQEYGTLAEKAGRHTIDIKRLQSERGGN